MQFPVIMTVDEDGKYTAVVPIIPGCLSCGDTREEALKNIRDAILLCLQSREEEGWEFPREYSVEHVDVVAA